MHDTTITMASSIVESLSADQLGIRVAVPKAVLRPTKVLAKGPIWARLPTLSTAQAGSSDTSTSTHTNDQHAQSQDTSTLMASNTVPILFPDRVDATKLLLHETQSCMQKISVGMDKLGTNVEQCVKDVQICRSTLEANNEKVVADVADVVYKCQSSLTKSIHTLSKSLEKMDGNLSHITSTTEYLTKLYDAHASSLQSLTQAQQTHASSLQTIQDQLIQTIKALVPLEPLIKLLPLQVVSSQKAAITEIISALKTSSNTESEASLGNRNFTRSHAISDTNLDITANNGIHVAVQRERKRRRTEDVALDTRSLRQAIKPINPTCCGSPQTSSLQNRYFTTPPPPERRSSILVTEGGIRSRPSIQEAKSLVNGNEISLSRAASRMVSSSTTCRTNTADHPGEAGGDEDTRATRVRTGLTKEILNLLTDPTTYMDISNSPLKTSRRVTRQSKSYVGRQAIQPPNRILGVSRMSSLFTDSVDHDRRSTMVKQAVLSGSDGLRHLTLPDGRKESDCQSKPVNKSKEDQYKEDRCNTITPEAQASKYNRRAPQEKAPTREISYSTNEASNDSGNALPNSPTPVSTNYRPQANLSRLSSKTLVSLNEKASPSRSKSARITGDESTTQQDSLTLLDIEVEDSAPETRLVTMRLSQNATTAPIEECRGNVYTSLATPALVANRPMVNLRTPIQDSTGRRKRYINTDEFSGFDVWFEDLGET